MTTPLFATAVVGKGQTWANSDGANAKKDLTAAATGNGLLIAAVSAISDDTSARLVQLFLNDGTTDFLIGTVNVPAASGTDGANGGIGLLSNVSLVPLSSSSNGDIAIPAGWKLRAATTTAVTSGKTVTVVALGGNL